MELDPKKAAIIVVLSVVVSFAFGRYFAPEKVKEVTKTVTIEKEVERKRQDTNKKTVIVTRPNGESRTEIVEVTHSDITKEGTKLSENEHSQEKSRSSDKVTILALGGVNVLSIDRNQVQYGLSVSRPILGPITVGLWGLSSGVGGLGVGVTF